MVHACLQSLCRFSVLVLPGFSLSSLDADSSLLSFFLSGRWIIRLHSFFSSSSTEQLNLVGLRRVGVGVVEASQRCVVTFGYVDDGDVSLQGRSSMLCECFDTLKKKKIA